MLSSQPSSSFGLLKLVVAEGKLFKLPAFSNHCFFKGITFNLRCWVIFCRSEDGLLCDVPPALWKAWTL